ncbi:TPA: glycosyltransferase [Morganella morganii]|nr:glycosyltransferase [Morganella morganii]
MNILIITTGLGMGGAERQIIALADKLSKNNTISIINLSDNNNTHCLPTNKDIKIYSLSLKKNIFSLVSSFIKAKKIIKAIKPDVIHSHMFHANIFARLLRLSINFPILICTAHSKNEGGKLRMLLYRITDWLATLSTNVSQEAVDAFIEKKATTPNKIIPFYNGVDTTIFSYSEIMRKTKRKEIGIADHVPLILAVGRLTKAKDYPNLLHAFSQLSFLTQPKLVIIGDGEEKKHLHCLAKELGIDTNIIWLGIRHDVQDWMSACDLFVLSSAWEGFGLVVAEAMSCKRLVIGTDSGGVSEVINKFGLIVPPNNTPALITAIEKYLSLSVSESDTIGKYAREHIIDSFSLEKISHNWLELYTNLLEKK